MSTEKSATTKMARSGLTTRVEHKINRHREVLEKLRARRDLRIDTQLRRTSSLRSAKSPSPHAGSHRSIQTASNISKGQFEAKDKNEAHKLQRGPGALFHLSSIFDRARNFLKRIRVLKPNPQAPFANLPLPPPKTISNLAGKRKHHDVEDPIQTDSQSKKARLEASSEVPHLPAHILTSKYGHNNTKAKTYSTIATLVSPIKHGKVPTRLSLYLNAKRTSTRTHASRRLIAKEFTFSKNTTKLDIDWSKFYPNTEGCEEASISGGSASQSTEPSAENSASDSSGSSTKSGILKKKSKQNNDDDVESSQKKKKSVRFAGPSVQIRKQNSPPSKKEQDDDKEMSAISSEITKEEEELILKGWNFPPPGFNETYGSSSEQNEGLSQETQLANGAPSSTSPHPEEEADLPSEKKHGIIEEPVTSTSQPSNTSSNQLASKPSTTLQDCITRARAFAKSRGLLKDEQLSADTETNKQLPPAPSTSVTNSNGKRNRDHHDVLFSREEIQRHIEQHESVRRKKARTIAPSPYPAAPSIFDSSSFPSKPKTIRNAMVPRQLRIKEQQGTGYKNTFPTRLSWKFEPEVVENIPRLGEELRRSVAQMEYDFQFAYSNPRQLRALELGEPLSKHAKQAAAAVLAAKKASEDAEMVVDQPITEVSQTTDTNNSTTSSSTQEETDTRTPQERAKATTIENNWNTTPLGTATNPQNPANTFTVFPSLPTELRLLIWKAAAHSPRVLPLKQQKCPRVRRQLAYIEQRTHNPIPSILLTNREARLEGLNYYTNIFGSHLFMRPLSDQARQTLMPRPEMLTSYVKYPTVHWNGGVDTIYFCEKYCDIPWGVHCSSDIPIRSIAFDVQVLFNRVDWEKKLFRVFEKFPIEEVYIVVRKNTVKDEELEREMEFVELTEKGDIHYGERGVARMNLYYDTHMDWTVWKDLQTKLATPERMVRYRFNYWNPKAILSEKFDAPKIGYGAENWDVDAEGIWEDDVEPIDDVYEDEKPTNRPVFKAVGIARGGVRL